MQANLIVGLGNPGVEYENTRHNIGFAVLDAFGEKYKIVGKQKDSLSCWYGREKIKINNEEHDLVLCWPITFINTSGSAVQKVLNWFKLEPKNLIVLHDEVALDLGKVRVSFNCSSAGHHGIESIIQQLGGNEEFTRLRVGIGPDPGGDKRADYVLNKFSPAEKELLQSVVECSINALETIILKGAGEAMNKYNGLDLTKDKLKNNI